MTTAELLTTAADRLAGYSSTPRLDVEVLLAHALKIDRSTLLSRLDQPVGAPDFRAFLDRRLAGEPVAYIVGHKEFWGRDFQVTPDVLIPRPDSETLISTTIEVIDSLSHPARVLEVGTGSGCLGLTVLAERPTTTAKLTDISPAALAVAHHNATALGVADRAEFATQDLLEGEDGHYDILITNLPYVPEHWLAQSDQAPETRGLPFEPRVALTGGQDGFDIFRRFVEQLAANQVAPVIILEHGDGQSELLAKLTAEQLPQAATNAIPDLSGTPRLLIVQLTNRPESLR